MIVFLITISMRQYLCKHLIVPNKKAIKNDERRSCFGSESDFWQPRFTFTILLSRDAWLPSLLDKNHCCWKELKQLASNIAKFEALKEQIRMHVLGFGWNDLRTFWSKGGEKNSWQILQNDLTEDIIPKQSKRKIPKKTPISLPVLEKMSVLGKDII